MTCVMKILQFKPPFYKELIKIFCTIFGTGIYKELKISNL